MKNVSHVGFKPMTLISMPAAHSSSDLRDKGWKVKKILACRMNYRLVLMYAACRLLQGCGLDPIEAKYFFDLNY